MINTVSFFDELEKIAEAGDIDYPLYTSKQVAMLDQIPTRSDEDAEDTDAFKLLEQSPEWKREEAIANTGLVPAFVGLGTGILGGGLAGQQLMRRGGSGALGQVGGALTGALLGSIAGGGTGSFIRDKLVDRARMKAYGI